MLELSYQDVKVPILDFQVERKFWFSLVPIQLLVMVDALLCSESYHIYVWEEDDAGGFKLSTRYEYDGCD